MAAENLTVQEQKVNVPAGLSFKAKKKRRDVLTRMQDMQYGPLSLLQKCVMEGLKVQVWTRSYNHVRGICTGYVIAFDKHFNLALMDVDEIYRDPLSLPQYAEKSKKTRRRRAKQQNTPKVAQVDGQVDTDDEEQNLITYRHIHSLARQCGYLWQMSSPDGDNMTEAEAQQQEAATVSKDLTNEVKSPHDDSKFFPSSSSCDDTSDEEGSKSSQTTQTQGASCALSQSEKNSSEKGNFQIAEKLSKSAVEKETTATEFRGKPLEAAAQAEVIETCSKTTCKDDMRDSDHPVPSTSKQSPDLSQSKMSLEDVSNYYEKMRLAESAMAHGAMEEEEEEPTVPVFSPVSTETLQGKLRPRDWKDDLKKDELFSDELHLVDERSKDSSNSTTCTSKGFNTSRISELFDHTILESGLASVACAEETETKHETKINEEQNISSVPTPQATTATDKTSENQPKSDFMQHRGTKDQSFSGESTESSDSEEESSTSSNDTESPKASDVSVNIQEGQETVLVSENKEGFSIARENQMRQHVDGQKDNTETGVLEKPELVTSVPGEIIGGTHTPLDRPESETSASSSSKSCDTDDRASSIISPFKPIRLTNIVRHPDEEHYSKVGATLLICYDKKELKSKAKEKAATNQENYSESEGREDKADNDSEIQGSLISTQNVSKCQRDITPESFTSDDKTSLMDTGDEHVHSSLSVSSQKTGEAVEVQLTSRRITRSLSNKSLETNLNLPQSQQGNIKQKSLNKNKSPIGQSEEKMEVDDDSIDSPKQISEKLNKAEETRSSDIGQSLLEKTERYLLGSDTETRDSEDFSNLPASKMQRGKKERAKEKTETTRGVQNRSSRRTSPGRSPVNLRRSSRLAEVNKKEVHQPKTATKEYEKKSKTSEKETKRIDKETEDSDFESSSSSDLPPGRLRSVVVKPKPFVQPQTSSTAQPKILTRHVNQLFIRGDNVVMVSIVEE